MKSIIGSLVNRAPVPYTRDSVFAPPETRPKDKSTLYLSAMEVQSTIFAIVDRISTDTAAVSWSLYPLDGNDWQSAAAIARRTEAERENIPDHPALVVWRKPNEFYTQTELVETVQQHFELVGEKTVVIVRPTATAGPPIELWPVRPDRMEPVPDRAKFIKRWDYRFGRETIPLRTEDVLYNKRPNPLNAYRGLGPIGTLMLDIEGEHAASEWNTMFFRQGAEPGGIIEIDEMLSDEEFDKLTEHWNTQHKGVRNAHRVAVVEAGTWKDRRFTFRDMQFEQLRRFSRETFRQAWGFPKALLGDVEDVNRANAEAGEVVLSRHIIVPRLNRWRTLLNDDFLPQFGALGKGYYFDYHDPVPPNRQEQGQNERMRALSVAGLARVGYDPAGVLEAFGFPPIEYLGPPETRFAPAEDEGDEADAEEAGEEDEGA